MSEQGPGAGAGRGAGKVRGVDKPRGVNRRASPCHPERAAASAADEGPKPAKPLRSPLPGYPTVSQLIPEWRGFGRPSHSDQCYQC
jgi:hypothetical protein